ncbi:MAG: hypothetical protein ABL902_01595 [Gallionella sp.]
MKFCTYRKLNWLFIDLFSRPLFLQPLRKIVLSAFLLTPCLAQAVQIGDIVSVSKLGQPLRAEVALTTSANEHIDSSCVSLVAPDAATEDANQYLSASNTNLSIQNNAGRPRVLLSSRKPFNEVFAKFRLHVQCLGEGSLTRTFTILPDIDTNALLPEPVVAAADPNLAPAAESVAQPTATQTNSPTNNIAAAPAANFTIAPSALKPRSHNHSRALKTPRNAPTNNDVGAFQLKISGDMIDASRIGKISDEERSFLLAKQKLLDSDDQMASILALQDQIKQLQDDIVAMKSQFAQLGAAPARVSLASESTAGVTTESMTNTPIIAASAPAKIPTKTVLQQPADWRTWAWQLGLLSLAILGVVWGLRRYADGKSASMPIQDKPEIISIRPIQNAIEPVQVAQEIAQPTSFQPAPAEPQPVVAPAPGEFTTKVRAMAQDAVAAKTVPTPAQLSVYAEIRPPQPSDNPHSEVDAIIEEAQLYAAFNHPLRAIKILQELLVDHPKKSEAWLLVLAIHSSLKNEHEFENNARAFLRYNPQDHQSWKTIQILGRTLNPTHALYRDNSPAISSDNILGERHLLGDVLIDLEMISPESLHHCLAHFDPNQHGRFGAYLVTEKVITHEQLTQALVLQNTVNQGVSFTPPIDLEFAPPDRSWQG